MSKKLSALARCGLACCLLSLLSNIYFGAPNLRKFESATATATATATRRPTSVLKLDDRSYCGAGPLPPSSGSGDGSAGNAHKYRCLVPHPDGLSADIVDMSRREVDHLRRVGEAFDMYPTDPNEVQWWGRMFNNMREVQCAAVVARANGMLLTLPRTLNKESSPKGKAPPSSYLDCVDFRHLRRGHESMMRMPFSGFRDHVRSDNWTAKTSFEISKFWFSMCKAPPLVDDMIHFQADAKRFLLTYWGIRPASYRCRPCTENVGRTAVAYVRAGDVFSGCGEEGKVPTYKGQPPLDFYIRGIRHSGARRVTVVAEDWGNPVVKALMNYNWTADGSGGPEVDVDVWVGGDFEDVLALLFCARTVLVGNTTIIAVLLFSPNLRAVYVGSKIEEGPSSGPPTSLGRGRFELRTGRKRADNSTSLYLDWSIRYEANLCATLKLFGSTNVFGYAPSYNPYNRWRCTKEQLDLMLAYDKGQIVQLIDNHANK